MGIDESEVQSSLLLNALPSLGPRAFTALIERFGAAAAALRAGPDAWAGVGGLDGPTIANAAAGMKQAEAAAQHDFRLAQDLGTRIYVAHAGPYPAALRQIYSPPPVIYAQGHDITDDRPAVAIVGSRRPSYYGEKIAKTLAADLAALGVITVSGLARGVDTAVHRATLESGGATWAVIGSGLSVVYPPENKPLAAAIAKTGAIISEFPMATLPFPANFPRRNRLIAGLTQATVVVEGTLKSGSLITARLAAHENRDVGAVPGPVTSPLSAAPHLLLREGAFLVESAGDIIANLGIGRASEGAGPSLIKATLTDDETRVAEVLGGTELPKEALAERLRWEPARLASVLLSMEVKGAIRAGPGGTVMTA